MSKKKASVAVHKVFNIDKNLDLTYSLCCVLLFHLVHFGNEICFSLLNLKHCLRECFIEKDINLTLKSFVISLK